MYTDILNIIRNASSINFEDASLMLERCIDEDTSFIETLKQIGTIPEFIEHDSTDEKLFSSDSERNKRGKRFFFC